MGKKDLTEQEIRTRYITPAVQAAGWSKGQIREELYLTDGQILPQGQKARRGKRKYADYVLYHHNRPLAIVEAKDNTHSVGSGIQQAIEYAMLCDAPFAYSSNGDGFMEYSLIPEAAPGSDHMVIERFLPPEAFPEPDTLWHSATPSTTR
jgi:type I restriction enzyme R subunit